MIYIKNRDEIERIRESNQIVAQTLLYIKGFIEPGITTGELNREIEDYIQKKKENRLSRACMVFLPAPVFRCRMRLFTEFRHLREN